MTKNVKSTKKREFHTRASSKMQNEGYNYVNVI